MLKIKLKNVLKYAKKDFKDYAIFTNRSAASISNKARRDSWSAHDLIQLAECTNTRLVYINNNNEIVESLNEINIKVKEKNE